MFPHLIPILAQLSLDIDLTPLWDQVNSMFGVFLPVIAIGGGISIAVGLATWIVSLIGKAIGRGRNG